MKRVLNCLYALLFLVLLLVPPNANTCFSISEAVFFYNRHPGAPLKEYTQGNLGVVLPQFERPYLVVAYRHLAGRPLSADEMNEALRFWHWKLQTRLADLDKSGIVKPWIDARAAVAGGQNRAPEINPDRPLRSYQNYANCLPDAFNNAALTLKDRARRFGAASPDVKEWLQAQDEVFSNCATGKVIPAELPQTAPQWLKDDRQYQIASANFYSQTFDVAAQRFDLIAGQESSPWHTVAPYLAARAFVRKATLIEDESKPFDASVLREAQSRLLKIASDPKRKDAQAQARKLLGLIELRLNPEARVHELAGLLSGPAPDPNFSQDLIDYNFGLRDLPPDAALRQNDDLTDWLLNLEDHSDASADHAVARWHSSHSLPWLFAAIAKVNAGSKAATELAVAAAKVPATSPAYAAFSYQRIRLLMQGGQRDQGLALLNQVLARVEKTVTPTSLNLFLIQRMQLASSYQDFLAHAALEVIDIDTGDGLSVWDGYCLPENCPDLINTRPQSQTGRNFNSVGAFVLNTQVPLDLLKEASLGQELPEKQRYQLAAATWTRAVLLHDYQTADALADAAGAGFPQAAEQLKAVHAASTPQEKSRAAIFALLHLPGMKPYVVSGLPRETSIDKIDNFRDNWWCDLPVVAERQKAEDGGGRPTMEDPKPTPAPPPPSFLSDQQASAARKQWESLKATDASANFLVQQTLSWAKESPDDPRLPEALHFAVRATRYGCTNDQTTQFSKQAFEVLHKRYPSSKWTKQTPYWY